MTSSFDRPSAAAPPPRISAVDDAEGRPAGSTNSMKRVAAASFIGTTIEYTDWGLYAFSAALVFPQVFFPALGPGASSVASLATLGVAFVARPLGSIVFGHFGDRLGRKKVLIVSLLMMGISTILIGAIPPAAQIGLLAPILLIALRVIQGLAVGGEWTGATLLASENAPKAKRGFWAMIPTLGSAAGSLLGPALILWPSATMSQEAFLSYGWRLPFLGSIVLVAIGLWMRLALDETPVFRNQIAATGTAKVPFVEAFKSQPREILIGAGTVVMSFALYYAGATFLANYATTTIGLSRTFVLVAGMIATVGYGIGLLVGGRLSDRLGRRSVLLIMISAGLLWSLVMFPLINTGTSGAYIIAAFGALFFCGCVLGPIGGLMTEMFSTRYRYTAAGVSYNLGALLGGAITPLVSGLITASWGVFAFGVYLAVISAVSLCCALALKETKNNDIEGATPELMAAPDSTSLHR